MQSVPPLAYNWLVYLPGGQQRDEVPTYQQTFASRDFSAIGTGSGIGIGNRFCLGKSNLFDFKTNVTFLNTPQASNLIGPQIIGKGSQVTAPIEYIPQAILSKL